MSDPSAPGPSDPGAISDAVDEMEERIVGHRVDPPGSDDIGDEPDADDPGPSSDAGASEPS